MNRFVLMLTVLLLAQMAYAAIDNALSPYEPAFWFWGGFATLAFIAWFLGRALKERISYGATAGKGRVLKEKIRHGATAGKGRALLG